MIGSGGVATQLGLALHQAGYDLRGIYSPTLSHARELAATIGIGASSCCDKLQDLPDANIVILSIKDDALPKVAQSWASLHPQTNALVLHTAGSVPLDCLSAHFAQAAVLYPLQTFSKTRRVDFHTIPLFVEANTPEALKRVVLLAQKLSSQVTQLDTERRKLLHLSAVFACNFTNHCYALAYRLLAQNGITPTCLRPLINETANKLESLTPDEAQTGPARRHDKTVMDRQLALITRQAPELAEIYQCLSSSIARFYPDEECHGQTP